MGRNAILLSMLFCAGVCVAVPAAAQVSFGLRTPNVSLGISVPLYPELVRVPGYPVYYASELNSNYFFYDGVYWVYQDDNWYASSWYNGPWELVDPDFVPLYVLRIPVRYYRLPPMYFRGWVSDAPPRWGQHWGNAWAQRRSGWDRWNRRSVPAPAPLPIYQRQYSGDRYPQLEQQHTLRNQHYTYRPRDSFVRQNFQRQQTQSTPTPVTPATRDVRQQRDLQQRESQQRDQSRSQPTDRQRNPGSPAEQNARRVQPSQAETPPVQQQRQQSAQRERQREQTPSNSDNREKRPQDKENERQPRREQKPNQENDREHGDDRRQDRR